MPTSDKKVKGIKADDDTAPEPEQKAQAPEPEQDLEAKVLFPMSPTSDFRSSYYAPSYDFPYNPDPLCAGNRYDTYDEMRKDDQVKACLALKKNLVINPGWIIECESEEVKEWFTEMLRGMHDDEAAGDSGFEDCLHSVLSNYDYGFSLTEVIAKLDEGKYAIKSLRTRAPHTWMFDVDDKGNLRGLIQNGRNGQLKLDPKHFLHHVHNQDFGNPYGTSDLQAAYPAWKAKKFFQRMFAVYAERHAGPTTVARYPNGTTQAEVDRIHEMIKSIQNSTAMTLPEDVLVDFVQSARDATDCYERGINLWNVQIARALLVPDLMGMSGGKTDGGSFSLGETQFKMFLGTVQRDRSSLERKLNLKIMRPFAALNFGGVEAKLKILPWSDDDMSRNMELWLKAVQANAYQPGPEEIDHFRDAIKFPKPPVEVLPRLPQDTQDEPQPGEGDNNDQGKPGEPKNGGGPVKPKAPPRTPVMTGKPAPKPERRNFSESAEVRIFRDLTPYEKKVDFAAVGKALGVGERSLSNTLEAAARKMSRDLLEQIRDKRISANFKPEAISTIEPRYAREMNEGLRSELRGLWRDSVEEARREILPSGTGRLYTASDILPEEFEAILEAESFKIVGDYRTEITKRAQRNLIQGVKNGLPDGKLAQIVKEDLADYTDRWLSSLVRTKTTEVYNSARKTLWDTDPTISQIVAAYQFSAIMDARTSDVCARLDGKIFEKSDFADRVTPPLHINCRSILVPITKFEDYKADKPISLEALKDLGGGLIQAIHNVQVKSFVEGQPISASFDLREAGDHAIIAPPGPGLHTHLLKVSGCNMDDAYPVVASIHESPERPRDCSMMVQKNGGVYSLDFFAQPKVLSENAPLYLNLSALVPFSVSLEYIVCDKDGKRVR